MPTTDWLNSLEDRGDPFADDLMQEDDDDYTVLRARYAAALTRFPIDYGPDDPDAMPF